MNYKQAVLAMLTEKEGECVSSNEIISILQTEYGRKVTRQWVNLVIQRLRIDYTIEASAGTSGGYVWKGAR